MSEDTMSTKVEEALKMKETKSDAPKAAPAKTVVEKVKEAVTIKPKAAPKPRKKPAVKVDPKAEKLGKFLKRYR